MFNVVSFESFCVLNTTTHIIYFLQETNLALKPNLVLELCDFKHASMGVEGIA